MEHNYSGVPADENLNNITSVNPVRAPGSAPDVNKPGITVRPVVQAMTLMITHQYAQSTSFLRRSHCGTPIAIPKNGPSKMLVLTENTIMNRIYPPIHPAALKIPQRHALCIRPCKTAHCKAEIATPDKIIGKLLKNNFPIIHPIVVAMIQ